MKIPRWLEHGFLALVDRVYAWTPQKKPSLELRQQVKIIAHRGAHNEIYLENTFEAFDNALALGLWSIEFDVRWTKDLVPVVHHDETCDRIFNKNIRIADVTFETLRAAESGIPSLQEVVDRYGKQLHLMIEMKEEHHPSVTKQNDVLRQTLSSLTPRKDYHIIALTPLIANYYTFLPPEAFLLIASVRSEAYAGLVVEKNYAGLLGHYFFIGNKLIKRLKSHHKQLGFGFISSKNSLWREINRGIFWLYTNNPEDLKRWLSE